MALLHTLVREPPHCILREGEHRHLRALYREPPKLRSGGYPDIGNVLRSFVLFVVIWTSASSTLPKHSWTTCVCTSTSPQASQ